MQTDLLTLSAPIEIQAADNKPATISILAYTGDVMTVSAYGAPIVIDLQGADVGGDIPLLGDHRADLDNIVGSGNAIVRSGKLHVEGVLARSSSAGSKVIALAKEGIRLQASVGYQPNDIEEIAPGEKVTVNGRTITASDRGLTIARAGKLREVSVLPCGADAATHVSISASRDKIMSDTQTTNTTNQTDAKKIAAEWSSAEWHYRDSGQYKHASKAMEAALAGKIGFDDFQTELAECQSRDRELHNLRESRPKAPAIHANNSDVLPMVMEAALCVRAGMKRPESQFDERTLDIASGQRYRNIGVQELLIQAASENGYVCRPGERVHNGNIREVLQYAFPPTLQAAFSTHTITTMLSTAGNKMLLDGFNSMPQKWREVATTKPVNDFKEATAYRLTADLEYKELPPAGEIKHGTLGQESYTMQAKTYARMAGLTRADIINDDLGAFDDLRNRLGIGASIKMNKVFWTQWVNNSTFFTDARGNYQEGAATNLSEAGLNTAVKLFRDMNGPDGNGMDLEPAVLAVPTDLEATAKILYASAEVRDTTASTKTQTANIYYNAFKPVAIPQLGNSGYTGYSTKAWYLLANPAVLATAVMCFLDGRETPTIESADADFNQLGIQFRGYHDFGVSMTEYRAGVKSKGEA